MHTAHKHTEQLEFFFELDQKTTFYSRYKIVCGKLNGGQHSAAQTNEEKKNYIYVSKMAAHRIYNTVLGKAFLRPSYASAAWKVLRCLVKLYCYAVLYQRIERRKIFLASNICKFPPFSMKFWALEFFEKNAQMVNLTNFYK